MIISLLIVFCLCMGGFTPPEIELSYSEQRYYVGEYQESTYTVVREYTIQNNSSEKVYTWLDYNYPSYKDDPGKAVRRYFFSLHGDFCFSNLFFDNVVLEEFLPIVGVFFLKIIEPGESFHYIEINSDDLSRYIVCFRETDFIKELGSPLDPSPSHRELFYEGDSIVIPILDSAGTREEGPYK